MDRNDNELQMAGDGREPDVDTPSMPDGDGRESGESNPPPAWLRDAARAEPVKPPWKPKEGDLIGGKLRITKLLGEGGLGMVFSARDLSPLHRDVAVKIMRIAGQEGVFEREATATARVRHPNVVTIHDFGRHEGAPYLVLELLEGTTLAERIDKGDMALPEAVSIMTDVAAGLAAAHSKGVVHRDLSANNVFLTEEGHVKVLDFGFAALDRKRKSVLSALQKDPDAREAGLDGSAPRGGTVGFMAPEQLQGQDETAKTDMWSAGVLLYLLIARTLPFDADSQKQYLEQVQKEAAPPLHKRVPAVPPALDALVARLLDKDPAQRPTAEELRNELRDIREDLEGRLSPAQRPRRIRPATTIENPFRPLRVFQAEDTEFFFGRDSELDELAELVRKSRLVVLHGASGTGKSSLLRAGLRPRIERAMAWMEVDSASNPAVSPLDALADAARAELTKRGREPTETKADLLLAAVAEAAGRPVLVVLDQFEEIFQHRTREEVEQAAGSLADALRRAIHIATVQIHVLIAVRADYLGHLHLLKEHLSGIFDAELLLEPLSADATRLAIEKPFELAGFDIPRSLVKLILSDLSDHGQVSPVELQLVCHALYERAEASGQRSIEPDAYEKLGGAGQVLANHLAQAEGQWSIKTAAVARDVLAQMVSPEGMRQPATGLPQLVGATRRPESRVQNALEHLVSARIVEPLGEHGGEGALWRIAHDRMALAVWNRLGEEEQRNIHLRDSVRDLAPRAPQGKLGLASWFLFGIQASTRAELLQWHARGAPGASDSDKAFLSRMASWDRRARWGKRSSAGFGIAVAAALVLLIFVQRNRLREQDVRAAEANAERELEHDPGKALAWMLEAARIRGGLMEEEDRAYHEHWLLAREAWHAGVGWVAAEHSGEVVKVAFSPPELAWMQVTGANNCPDCWPHRKLLLSIGKDGTARILDLATGGRAITLPDESNSPLVDALFLPDGRSVVAADISDRIYVWDMQSYSLALALYAPRGGEQISLLAASRDGKRLAVGYWDGVIDLWEIGWCTIEHIRSITDHKTTIYDMIFAPDGRRLFSIDNAGHVRQTELPVGESTSIYKASNARAGNDISLSPDGALLGISADGGIKIFPRQKKTGSRDTYFQRGEKIETGAPASIAIFSLDGYEFVIAGIADGEVSEWALKETPWPKKKKIHTHQRQEGGISSLSLSRTGQRILSSGFDGRVLVSYKGNMSDRLFSGHDGRVLTAAMSPDERLVASGGTDGQVLVWLVEDGNDMRVVAPSPVTSLATPRPTERVVAGLFNGQIALWENHDWTPTKMSELKQSSKPIFAMCTLSDGGFAFGIPGGAIEIHHKDGTFDRILHPNKPHDFVHSLLCFRDGRILSSHSGSVLLWQQGKDQAKVIRKQVDPAVSLGLAPGEQVVTGLHRESVAVWDVKEWKLLTLWTGEAGSIAVAPLGREEVAIALRNGQVVVWNWTAGKTRELEPRHSGQVSGIVVLPEAKLLASSSDDGTVRLRWVDSGASRPIRAHVAVQSVAFSEDGRFLVSGGGNGDIRVWPLPPTDREEFRKWVEFRTPWVVKDGELVAKEVPPLSDEFGGPEPPPPSPECIEACRKAQPNDQDPPDGETMETCVLRKLETACKPKP